MNTTQRAQLVAEKGFLQAQLASLSANALLTRSSVESRLRHVEEALRALQESGFEPARAYLTFKGKPVSGTHGIAAEFGSKAVNAFVDAVAAVAASCQTTLRNMGPIPHREENQLLITDIVRGSFGFELEERGNGQLALDVESPVRAALERTHALLRNSAEGTDEALADAADGLDRRALKSLHKFVSTLVEDDALCALRLGDDVFRFADMGQVRHSFEQLSDDNVHEEERTLQGRFNGMIPVRRTFEFQTADGEVLVGRTSDAVAEPALVNDHLHEDVEARFQVTQIGQGRPRYTLLEMPQWPQERSAGAITLPGPDAT